MKPLPSRSKCFHYALYQRDKKPQARGRDAIALRPPFQTQINFRHKNIRNRFLWLNNNTHANLFSPCVFLMGNIGGVAASRGGWRISQNVKISINPSVTYVTAPLSLRAEEQKYTTRHAKKNMFLMLFVGESSFVSSVLLSIKIPKRGLLFLLSLCL